MSERIVLLRGIVGSTAYGMAREGSDVDRLGVFAYRTDAFWHLGQLRETHVDLAPLPDMTEHEIAKCLTLALKCNPAIMELLWLPQSGYEVRTAIGEELRMMRGAFLSESSVRRTYGGYAKQQADRLRRRNAEGKDSFSSDTKKRTAKHARHLFRLFAQGRELLETGELTVRVKDPTVYWRFDNMPVEDILAAFDEEHEEFQSVVSVLPESPDFERVDMFLYRVRRTLLG